MIQGTASTVGKSLLVAGLCRLFRQDGLRVAPFKAQNMSLNSYVTPEGDEIGRAQAVQAEAAGLAPHVDMNPILLKPEADTRSQVVLMGKPWRSLPAGTYYQHKGELWPAVTGALDRLRARYDLVLIEGAGSPAEINLRAGDMVNMAVARYAQAPVLLVGDIDRGGVFAALIGTLVLLEPEERALVRGLLINKFRGERALLDEGLAMLEERAGLPVLGVVPFLHGLAIAEEDGVYLEQPGQGVAAESLAGVDIAVVHLPHISNFDDFDALKLEPGVSLRFVTTPEALRGAQAIILPGSKNTLADLAWLRTQGLAEAIVARAQAGAAVVGICGGYQMLGRTLTDPHGVDGCGPGACMAGLGLLPVETTFCPRKHTYQVHARVLAGEGLFRQAAGSEVTGYEIHMGESRGGRPALEIVRRGSEQLAQPDGAVDPSGRIFGTYLHGLFDTPAFRRAWLESLGWRGSGEAFALRQVREAAYDRLAAALRESVDVGALYRLLDETRMKRET